ncbi:hypothetical protein F7R20_15455 [Pseudomonas brassicacearum subsp. brassicacearum]|nr:hypothetical protein F7R20_15455 [Pseudomonas brassicacearum subsp. brassicacearum]PJH89255.1 hypothetical protein CVG87_11970 [Pseudomonas sp. WCS365]QEO76663.1 hypothetical protein ELZ14_03510 [Pseudomonas brassicacearum]
MGASLLAIALGQLALMLNGPPSSRAGSLPQGFGSNRMTGSGTWVTNFAQTSVIVLAIAENWTVTKALRHSRQVLIPAHR